MSESVMFLWQRGYNKKWTTYSYKDCCILNKAFTKNQKTVKLAHEVSNKDVIVNFNDMFQKNITTGYEQCIRCLLFNGGYFSWVWQDDHENFLSYSPRIALYLETAHEKGLEKVDVLLKEEYEIDLMRFKQKNKATGNIRKIARISVTVDISKWKNTEKEDVLQWNKHFRDSVRKMSNADERSLKNILFALPVEENPEMMDFDLPELNPELISSLREESTSSSSMPSVGVDPVCPEARNCHVYYDGEKFYSAVLNLTSMAANSNKFYNIQLLEFNDVHKYVVWFHWGRVGYFGQTNLCSYKDLETAKSEFEKKFYDKTKNHFKNVKHFQRVPTKYDLVDVDLSSTVPSLPTVQSSLDEKVQSLLELICDKETLEEAAKDLMYDSKAIPLGKITAKQIEEGYHALKKISELIKANKIGKALVEACDVFYTKIPHNFKRKTPALIKTADDVKEKLRMLEALSNICLAMNIIGTSVGVENPIDAYYKRLECDLISIEHNSEEFYALKKSVEETHGPSHFFKLSITEAFKCIKDEQESQFTDFGNKKLLFHGSRIANWLSILKKGLQVAPPEAPVSGYMFGKGVYFADMATKSANYCYPTRSCEGLLLISEVSLGNALEVTEAKDCSRLPNAYQSVFAKGKLTPNFETTILSSEATVPCQPLVERDAEDIPLRYNEYVVYNTQQIKMKYLLRIKFVFSSG